MMSPLHLQTEQPTMSWENWYVELCSILAEAMKIDKLAAQRYINIDIAKECIKYGIKGIFAGPIRDYPLLDYIDNKNTFYVGILSEEDKLNYTKKAKLYTLPLKWEVAFNQSAIEAGGLGTPILATKKGWFNEYIKENINGFFYDGTNFLECYQKSDKIDQRLCWESAKEFSIENMINSFYKAFNEIKNEWDYRK